MPIYCITKIYNREPTEIPYKTCRAVLIKVGWMPTYVIEKNNCHMPIFWLLLTTVHFSSFGPSKRINYQERTNSFKILLAGEGNYFSHLKDVYTLTDAKHRVQQLSSKLAICVSSNCNKFEESCHGPNLCILNRRM